MLIAPLTSKPNRTEPLQEWAGTAVGALETPGRELELFTSRKHPIFELSAIQVAVSRYIEKEKVGGNKNIKVGVSITFGLRHKHSPNFSRLQS